MSEGAIGRPVIKRPLRRSYVNNETSDINVTEKEENFNRIVAIHEDTCRKALVDFRDIFADYVRRNFLAKVKGHRDSHKFLAEAQTNIKEFLQQLIVHARDNNLEEMKFHARNYRSQQARSVTVENQFDKEYKKRISYAGGSSIYQPITLLSEETSNPSHLAQLDTISKVASGRKSCGLTARESVIIELDDDVNMGVAIGTDDVVQNVTLVEDKLDREKNFLAKYLSVDKELDRCILRAIIPSLTIALREYEIRNSFAMCIRRDMVPLSEIGMKQFFQKLRKEMNTNKDKIIRLDKLQRGDLDFSNTDITFEDVACVLIVIFGLESLLMALLFKYHMTGRWLFVRDFLLVLWREPDTQVNIGKYMSSLLRIENHRGERFLRGEDRNGPLNDTWVERELTKWLYIEEKVACGGQLVARKRTAAESAGSPDEEDEDFLVDIDSTEPVVQKMKLNSGKSVGKRGKTKTNVPTVSKSVSSDPNAIILTDEEKKAILLNTSTQLSVQKCWQQAWILMLKNTSFNTQSTERMEFPLLVKRPPNFFNMKLSKKERMAGTPVTFVMAFSRVETGLDFSYDYWDRNITPGCNLLNYINKLPEIIHVKQRGNPSDMRWQAGPKFPHFVHGAIKIAIYPSRCDPRCHNYYMGGTTKSIMDKQPFWHCNWKCQDPFCKMRGQVIIPDEPQEGVEVKLIVCVICTKDDVAPFSILNKVTYFDRVKPESWKQFLINHEILVRSQHTTGNLVTGKPSSKLRFLDSPILVPYDTVDKRLKWKAPVGYFCLPPSITKSLNQKTGKPQYTVNALNDNDSFRKYEEKIHEASKDFSKNTVFKSSTVEKLMEEIKTGEFDIEPEFEYVKQPSRTSGRRRNTALLPDVSEMIKLTIPPNLEAIVDKTQQDGYEYTKSRKHKGFSTTPNYTLQQHDKIIAQKKGQDYILQYDIQPQKSSSGRRLPESRTRVIDDRETTDFDKSIESLAEKIPSTGRIDSLDQNALLSSSNEGSENSGNEEDHGLELHRRNASVNKQSVLLGGDDYQTENQLNDSLESEDADSKTVQSSSNDESVDNLNDLLISPTHNEPVAEQDSNIDETGNKQSSTQVVFETVVEKSDISNKALKFISPCRKIEDLPETENIEYVCELDTGLRQCFSASIMDHIERVPSGLADMINSYKIYSTESNDPTDVNAGEKNINEYVSNMAIYITNSLKESVAGKVNPV